MNQKALQAKKDAVAAIKDSLSKSASFTVVSYQDSRQMRDLPSLRLDAGDLFRHLLLHLSGNSLTIQ